jgi:hypothetical protein
MVAGRSKAVRTFGPEYAPSLFSGLVPCIDALWIRLGRGELKYRLANAESRLADAEQERPSPDPCRFYSTLFNNLDAGVANLESCVTIKVASSTFQESPPVQSIRL